MSSSTFKPLAYRIPPAAGADGSLSKVTRVTMMNRQAPAPLRVKGKEKIVLKESLSATSRREMLHLSAASVALLSILLPAPAEAAARNATMTQKILEKFEELRRKVGLSKPKHEEGEDTKTKDERDGKSKVEINTKAADPKTKDESEAKSKVENGVKETKPEAKDEKKHTSMGQEMKVTSSDGPVIPALPGIINGKTVDTTLP